MAKKWITLFMWVFGILVFDQLTKYWIVANFPLGSKWALIPHFVDIVHYRNPGAAFGMLSGWNSHLRNYFFFGVSLVAITILIVYWWRTPLKERGTRIPLMMILGGAIGNLVDRAIRGNVVDFILLHWYDKVVQFKLFGKTYFLELVWPAFNAADSCITVGVVWLLVTNLFGVHRREGG